MGQTCPTNCGVVVVRRVIIIAAVSRHHLAVMWLFRPKRNLRVHLLDAMIERFRGDFPKMFGFFRKRFQKCSAFWGIDSKNVIIFAIIKYMRYDKESIRSQYTKSAWRRESNHNNGSTPGGQIHAIAPNAWVKRRYFVA